MSGERTIRSGRQTVTMRHDSGEDEATIAKDFARSLNLGDSLAERGTEQWLSHFRRIGSLRVMVAKEVGPPPWTWPKVLVEVKRKPRLWLAVKAGWRSTAFAFYAMWRPLNPAGIEANQGDE